MTASDHSTFAAAQRVGSAGQPRDSISVRALLVLGVTCLLAPILHLIALGPEIPEGTFLLISTLRQVGSHTDAANLVYAFARPPVFDLLGEVFLQPAAFLVVGYVCHVAMQATIATLFYLAVRAVRSPRTPSMSDALLTAALTLLVFPVGHLLNVDDYGVSLIPHDSYHTFSHRTLFWLAIGVGTILANQARTNLACWCLSLGCFLHPTAGILGFAICAPLVLVTSARKRDGLLLINFAGAAVIGASPTLLKMLSADFPPELMRPVSDAAWYSANIKDEADDFSLLYQLIYRGQLCAFLLGICASIAVVYARTFRHFRSKPAFWLMVLAPSLFIVGALLELFFCVLIPTPLVRLDLPLTPGYRLLSYAFFPALVLVGQLAARSFDTLATFLVPYTARCKISTVDASHIVLAALVAVPMLIFTAPGVRRGEAQASWRFGVWSMQADRVQGIDEYLAAASRSGIPRFHQPRLFRFAGAPHTYPNERNLLRIRAVDRTQPKADREKLDERFAEQNFVDLMQKLRAKLEVDQGVFIPPYLLYFRDSLLNNPVFFQEHHDGNMMMGSAAICGFYQRRMIDLLGFDYEGMPSQHSLLSTTAMRNAYLRIDSPNAAALFSGYPRYPYFITEIDHRLEFVVVVSNAAFVVYDLRRPLVPTTGETRLN